MKVYIAGPMTGIPEFNAPEFERVEQALREAGHEPVNPHKLHDEPEPGSLTHAEYMRTDIAALCECEGITMLNGWADSKGASLEYAVAVAIGLMFLKADGTPFRPRDSRRKLSVLCCQQCGQEFEAKRSDSKWCGDACRTAAYRERVASAS